MPKIDLSMLNQRQTPAFYADVLANRPAAGFIGRIFVSTNTYAFYRDNGTGWDLIGGPGTGTVTGSGAANQVAFWGGASLITGENNLWWDDVNNYLGVGTGTPGAAIDAHSAVNVIQQLNQTVATNNSLLAFQNAGAGLWRIGNYYNAGANDFGVYDVVGAVQQFTIKKTTGQTLIGGGTGGSGKLVVESGASDNGIQIVGASAPSLRIDSAATGPTKRIGLGISTGVNNFIQGSADRDMCIFNGSTTASPMLFGIYDTTNVQEAARISAARNFLIGTTTDGGQKLQVNGGARTTGYYLAGMTAGSGALYWTSDRVTIANYNSGGSVLIEVNGGVNGLLIASDLSATFYSKIIGVTTGLNSGFNTGAFIAKSSGNNFRYTQIGYDNTGNYGWIQALEEGTAYTNLLLNAAGGNIGIGSVNASSLLHLSGGGTGTRGALRFSDQGGTNYWEIGRDNNSTGNFTFNSQANQLMTLATTGNLLIGTTTDAGQKLQVNGSAYISGTTLSNQIRTSQGSTSVPYPGNTTIFTLSSGNFAIYTVYAYLASAGGIYTSYATIVQNDTTLTIANVFLGGACSLSVSGLNVQVSQGSGITQVINWTYLKIA